ncbi:MAG: hypothetical protein GXO64_03180, partial [Candidatus Micrarchaeota archaeon]|nr:hypothetical protein [Candidatus Micrarchaeota archaeon]
MLNPHVYILTADIDNDEDIFISKANKLFGVNSPVKSEHAGSGKIFEMTKYGGDLLLLPPELFRILVKQHVRIFGDENAIVNEHDDIKWAEGCIFRNNVRSNLNYLEGVFKNIYELHRTTNGKEVEITIRKNGKTATLDSRLPYFGVLLNQNPPLNTVNIENRQAYLISWLDDRINEARYFSDMINYIKCVKMKPKLIAKEIRDTLENEGIFTIKMYGEKYPTSGGRQTYIVNRNTDIEKLCEKLRKFYSEGTFAMFYKYCRPFILETENNERCVVQLRPQYDMNGRLAYLLIESAEKCFNLGNDAERKVSDIIINGNKEELSVLSYKKMKRTFNTSHLRKKYYILIINRSFY